MIKISDIVSSWEKRGDWAISPGVPWCAKGNMIIVGYNCQFGDGCRIGNN